MVVPPPPTPVQHGVLERQQPPVSLQRGAVPAVVPELVLALVDGHLEALQGGGRHVGAADAHPHLPLAESRQPQTHGVGGQHWISCPLQAQHVVTQHPAERWMARRRMEFITLSTRLIRQLRGNFLTASVQKKDLKIILKCKLHHTKILS